MLLFSACSQISQPVNKEPLLNSLITLEDLGGLSGLAYTGSSKEELYFWTHTDRGPNTEGVSSTESKMTKRPFMNPEFQPYWIKFSINKETLKVNVLKAVKLQLTGLPNHYNDEQPVNLKGEELSRDPMGIDPEAICFDGKYVWMGEEYGPSLLKFSLEGKLLRRYGPQGKKLRSKSYPSINVNTLPKKLMQRRLNRGFEGIACANKKIYAILQSPLPEDDNKVLIIKFNPVSERVENEYYYPLETGKTDKIGDMDFFNGKFYVIEQSGGVGPRSFHRIFSFDLESIQGQVVRKFQVFDLVNAGYSFAEKVEGLAIIDDKKFAVVNDNDFELTGRINNKGIAETDESKKSVLGIYCMNSSCRQSEEP